MISDFLNKYNKVRHIENKWRIEVFRGDVEFTFKTNEQIRTLYFELLEGAEKHQQCTEILNLIKEVKEILRHWEEPTLATAVSFRPAANSLSPEEVKRFYELFPEFRR